MILNLVYHGMRVVPLSHIENSKSMVNSGVDSIIDYFSRVTDSWVSHTAISEVASGNSDDASVSTFGNGDEDVQ